MTVDLAFGPVQMIALACVPAIFGALAGPLIGAGVSALGGLFSSKSGAKDSRRARRLQEEAIQAARASQGQAQQLFGQTAPLRNAFINDALGFQGAPGNPFNPRGQAGLNQTLDQQRLAGDLRNILRFGSPGGGGGSSLGAFANLFGGAPGGGGGSPTLPAAVGGGPRGAPVPGGGDALASILSQIGGGRGGLGGGFAPPSSGLGPNVSTSPIDPRNPLTFQTITANRSGDQALSELASLLFGGGS